jgi:hypothetical protein
MAIGEAEYSDVALRQSQQLGRAPTDPIILAEDHPVTGSRQVNPVNVLDFLRCGFTIDVRKSLNCQANLPQGSQEHEPTQTAVDQELRLPGGVSPTG